MNIFYLYRDPRRIAQSLGDEHVHKMTLETAQMLSTVHRDTKDLPVPIYKPTHINHPVTRWVDDRIANYNWTVTLFRELLAEYLLRFGRDHASARLLPAFASPPWQCQIGGHRTDPPQCMPEGFRGRDTVVAYRHYYVQKWHAGKVTYERGRAMPLWLREMTRT